MSESNKAVTDHQPEADRPANEIPPMDWRRSSIGVGVFVMVCALFAMAFGQSSSQLPRKASPGRRLLIDSCPHCHQYCQFCLILDQTRKRDDHQARILTTSRGFKDQGGDGAARPRKPGHRSLSFGESECSAALCARSAMRSR